VTEPKQPLPAYYAALGEIAASWASLEFTLNHIIWDLMGVEQRIGACVTSQMIGPTPRMKALVALVTERGGKEELIKAINSFSGTIEGLGRQRNRFLHDLWTENTLTGGTFRVEITADRSVTYELKPDELIVMAKLTKDIRKASDDSAPLYARIISELPAWPRTRFLQSPGIFLFPRTETGNSPTTPEHRPQPSP
jgi:hypothetical protein